MKKIFRFKKILLVLSMILLLPSVSQASKEASRDTFVYGAGLSDEQVQKVKEVLDVRSDATISTVRGEDAEKYLGYYRDDSNWISSVLVRKLKRGEGIKVNIKTPENIQSVTEGQYTNAAITAGITDSEINVASPVPVTGESALTGVYKSIEVNGGEVEADRAQLAQEEIGTLQKINEENESNNNFDTKKLDQAVAEVKQNLQQHKEETGEVANADQIRVYIEDALKNVNMGDILSNNNIQILVNYFDKYQDTSAIDSEEVKENLKQFAGDVTEKGKKFYEDNKDQIDKVGKDIQESGLLDKIINFFKDLFNSFFGSNENTENQN